MIWQSCDNLRAATLNETMAEQLCSYLAGKESELCTFLQNTVRIFPELPPQLTPYSPGPIRLGATIDEIGKRLQRMSSMPHVTIPQKEWNKIIDNINASLWDYIEILETSLSELFQQIDQIGFEQWSLELSDAATQIKDELTHRLDDVIWGIRRFNKYLGDIYKKIVRPRNPLKALMGSSVLDPSLESTAKKCLKYLNFRYGKFVERYVGYLELYDEAEAPMKKAQQYRALASLDMSSQEKYKQLTFLLRLWDLNRHARTLPRGETVRALRSIATYESNFQLFREYLSTIRMSIFGKSRMIKDHSGDFLESRQSHVLLMEQLNGLQNELHSFAINVDKYRQFLTSMNASQKSKLALSRWFGNHENKQTRALLGLVQESEQLDNLCKHFVTSLQKESTSQSNLTPELEQSITRHLHEMGQPLASKVMMRRHAKAVVQSLQKIDEIGSFHQSDVEYISRILCKLMRIDWKYHVVFDVPGFQALFQNHLHLIDVGEERQHVHRYNTFKKVFQQIEQWMASGDFVKHAHEVDLDINDTKSLLQDFLGQVQNSKPFTPETQAMATKQLLEYLFLFGNFFHRLQVGDPDQRQLRRRFLFVDQYFDAIEIAMRAS